MPPDAVGSVELRGSAWSAKNVATQIIHKGQRCTVQRVDGLKLYVAAGRSALRWVQSLSVFFLVILVLIVIAKTAVVVPQQSAFVVERLGRYSGTLDAGFHILIPFLDVIRYKHSLKEAAIDIPAQVCITRDNVQVRVDGILYLKVLNPERASYGISDYIFAITQLAQTTLRSEIGKIDLDRTFEERTNINTQVVRSWTRRPSPGA